MKQGKRKRYPAEFRQQIVELVKAGRKPIDLAQEFGCHITSIHDWIARAAISDNSPSADTSAALSVNEREELVRLRKQLKQVELERDILAKATAWFAHNGVTTPPSSTR